MGLRDFAEVCLPYCLERQDDGLYLARNREYLPLGFTDKKCDRDVGARFKISKSLAHKLAHAFRNDFAEIWLYADVCKPMSSAANWKTYQAKLRLLAKAQVRVINTARSGPTP